MAYKNIITSWQDIELTAQEIASVRAIVTGAFKRAGGKGALPSVVSCKNILKGKIAVDAESFTAGNVEAPAQIMAKPLSKLAAPSSAGGVEGSSYAPYARLRCKPCAQRKAQRQDAATKPRQSRSGGLII